MLVPLIALLVAVPPIPQDPGYHALADNRQLLGVPNFVNVASNAGFLAAGVLGLILCLRRRVEGASRSWTVFFVGTLLVAFGSAYYHWNPDSATLVWDRLPMTIAFMALFSALIAEHFRAEIERMLLRTAVVVGAASVAWWHYTDDLRLYAWVQFSPLVAIVFVLIAFPARYTHRTYLLWGLAFYGIAKAAEFGDAAIFDATAGIVSGHSLKHLLAACAPFVVYLMLESRSRIAATSSSVTSLHSS